MIFAVTVKKRKTSVNEKRLFFVIPKKVVPKASVRNKIKRRVRYILKPFLLKKSEYGYTVFIRRGAEKLTFIEFKSQILSQI